MLHKSIVYLLQKKNPEFFIPTPPVSTVSKSHHSVTSSSKRSKTIDLAERLAAKNFHLANPRHVNFKKDGASCWAAMNGLDPPPKLHRFIFLQENMFFKKSEHSKAVSTGPFQHIPSCFAAFQTSLNAMLRLSTGTWPFFLNFGHQKKATATPEILILSGW